jgi:hypothetical protein
MRSIIYSLICLLLFSSIACKNHQYESDLEQKEAELEERERKLKEREDMQQDSYNTDIGSAKNTNAEPTYTKKVTKYMYVLITTNEPQIHQRVEEASRPAVSSGYYDEPREMPKYTTYTTNRFFDYASDILEIQDFNDDKRYKVIEGFEKEIRSKISFLNSNLQVNESVLGSGGGLNAKAEILSRKSFVFDSYGEASEHKSDNVK